MIKQILTGWKNYLDTSEVTESLAHNRARICAACPHAKQGKLLAFIKDSLTEIKVPTAIYVNARLAQRCAATIFVLKTNGNYNDTI